MLMHKQGVIKSLLGSCQPLHKHTNTHSLKRHNADTKLDTLLNKKKIKVKDLTEKRQLLTFTRPLMQGHSISGRGQGLPEGSSCVWDW